VAIKSREHPLSWGEKKAWERIISITATDYSLRDLMLYTSELLSDLAREYDSECRDFKVEYNKHTDRVSHASIKISNPRRHTHE